MRHFPWLLVALALVATDVPVVHTHDGATPGLYNEECPLARLATPPSAALANADPPAAALGPAPEPPAAALTPAPAAAPLDPHGARAPPTDPFSI